MATIQEQVMQKRRAAGLVLTFRIPDRSDLFTCYPKDEADKARWQANARQKGWEEVA